MSTDTLFAAFHALSVYEALPKIARVFGFYAKQVLVLDGNSPVQHTTVRVSGNEILKTDLNGFTRRFWVAQRTVDIYIHFVCSKDGRRYDLMKEFRFSADDSHVFVCQLNP